ncbi:uncharacterized protein CCOS01_13094 [Colletotrichum costaricense]|uniref:Uncharacterized protein n=1 Tax=Colletotrichum costaricense TaxID=1209916 RepID=A0AAJ0DW76_9PEZI|nr:uncharacterized protein CCOS01_13094 [Colletotrichum costaricense]KAK1515896.1 hypothetical protein CCOS01_13094 [Colletotrichum costaricense]
MLLDGSMECPIASCETELPSSSFEYDWAVCLRDEQQENRPQHSTGNEYRDASFNGKEEVNECAADNGQRSRASETDNEPAYQYRLDVCCDCNWYVENAEDEESQ